MMCGQRESVVRWAAYTMHKLRERRSLLGILAIALVAVLMSCGGGSSAVTGDPALTLTIDAPAAASRIELPLALAGWSADTSQTSDPGIERVEILDGGCNGTVVGTARSGIERPDVAAAHGEKFLQSGWEISFETFSAGDHHLAVRATQEDGAASTCESINVVVQPQPTLQIEAPVSGPELLPVRVAGWAADLGAEDGTGVEHVEILDDGCEGELLGRAEYGIVRGDVAERYGHQFGESGWELTLDQLSRGVHTLGVRLISDGADTTACETVVISVL